MCVVLAFPAHPGVIKFYQTGGQGQHLVAQLLVIMMHSTPAYATHTHTLTHTHTHSHTHTTHTRTHRLACTHASRDAFIGSFCGCCVHSSVVSTCEAWSFQVVLHQVE